MRIKCDFILQVVQINPEPPPFRLTTQASLRSLELPQFQLFIFFTPPGYKTWYMILTFHFFLLNRKKVGSFPAIHIDKKRTTSVTSDYLGKH